MRTIKSRVFSLILIILCLFQCSLVYASEIDATLQTVTNSAYLSDLCSQANYSVNEDILSYEAGSGILRFNNRVYSSMSAKDKKAFMEVSLSYVMSIPDNASIKMKNSVYNFISKQDTAVSSALKYLQVNTGADLVEAEKWFSPISPYISTLLGVMSLLVFLFLGISIMIDIFYIVLPPFRAALSIGSDVNKRPWGISYEAFTTVTESEKTEEYKNVLAIYARRRMGVIIIASIAITYLVSGKIYDVVVWLIDSFS